MIPSEIAPAIICCAILAGSFVISIQLGRRAGRRALSDKINHFVKPGGQDPGAGNAGAK